MQSGAIGENLIGVGQFTAFIPSESSTTTVKTGKGRLCRISITTAGTAGFTVFDNTAGSGNLIYASTATTAIGTVIDIQIPVEISITIVNAVSGPVFCVSFD